MRVLVVGGGGREQAIAWACRHHGHDVRLALDLGDASAGDTDLVIPGPEAALVAGVADECAARNIPCFGPTAELARLESSKTYARELATTLGIPGPRFAFFDAADAADAAMKDKKFSRVLALLHRTELLSDHADWTARFVSMLMNSNFLPTSPDALPVYNFVIAKATPQLRAYMADVLGYRAANLHSDRKDFAAAEALHRLASEADPANANNLSTYAVFLHTKRKDMDAAEALYRRALEADPFHLHGLGNYADFLNTVRNDMDAAEAVYRRAIEAGPSHADILGNYATFLRMVRKDMGAAEVFYRRAIEAAPSHPGILGNYANFLHTVRKDMGAAESIYRRALEVDPANADNLGNYAHLCITSGRPLEGLILVDRALAASNSDTPQVVELECQMYLYCCGAPERGNIALSRLKHLITIEHLDTGEWDFSGVILQAEKMGHPEARWLPALAEVLAKRATASSLDAWDAWRVAS